jgi:hypothetical protein
MSKKERLFWESRFSTMSSAKWFKLFTLLHQLKIPFPPLKKPIKIRWIWSNDNWNEPKDFYYDSFLPNPETDLDMTSGFCEIRDGSPLGGGPAYLREIFEIYIPIASKEVVMHKLIAPTTREQDLFPNLKDFLEKLNKKAQFSYRIEESYSNIPNERRSKSPIGQGSSEADQLFVFYKHLVFFGYSSLSDE